MHRSSIFITSKTLIIPGKHAFKHLCDIQTVNRYFLSTLLRTVAKNDYSLYVKKILLLNVGSC